MKAILKAINDYGKLRYLDNTTAKHICQNLKEEGGATEMRFVAESELEINNDELSIILLCNKISLEAPKTRCVFNITYSIFDIKTRSVFLEGFLSFGISVPDNKDLDIILPKEWKVTKYNKNYEVE